MALFKTKILLRITAFFFIGISQSFSQGKLQDTDDTFKNIFVLVNNGNTLIHGNLETNISSKISLNNNTFKSIQVINNTSICLLTMSNDFVIYDFKINQIYKSFRNITAYYLLNNHILLGTKEGYLHEIDTINFQVLKTYQFYNSSILAITRSPKNYYLTLGFNNGNIVQLSEKNNSIIKSTNVPLSHITDIEYDATEKYLVVTTEKTCVVYDSKFKVVGESEYIDEFGPYISHHPSIKNLFFGSNSSHLNSMDLSITKNKIILNSINYYPLGTINTKNENIISFSYIDNEDKLIFTMAPIKFKMDKEYFDNHIDLLFKDSTTIDLQNSTPIKLLLPEGVEIRNNAIEITTDEINHKTENKNTNKLEVLSQFGFAGPIKDVLYSQSENIFITYAASPVIKFWDFEHFTMIKEMMLPEFNILSATVHPKLPLLAVWDKNYDIFLIDLKSFTIIKQIKYANEKYLYLGDDDDYYRTATLNFIKEGEYLRAWSEYYDQNDSRNINFKTNNLLNNKIEKIKFNENIISEISNQNEFILPVIKISDTVKSERTGGEDVTVHITDSSYIFIDQYNLDTIRNFLKGSIYDNYELTQLFIPDTSEHYFDFYHKLKNPIISHKKYRIINHTENYEYLLVTPDTNLTQAIYQIINRKTGETILSNVSKFDQFINLGEKYIIHNKSVYSLKTGFSLSVGLSALESTMFKPESFENQYVPIQLYESDKNNEYKIIEVDKSKTVYIWHPKYDNKILKLYTKDNSFEIIEIPKPEIGRVIPSLYPIVSYINYQDHFSRFDPINLDVSNYWINEGWDGTNRTFSISKKKSTNSKKINFYFFQHSESDFSEYLNCLDCYNGVYNREEMRFYTFNDQFQFHCSKTRLLVDLKNFSLKKVDDYNFTFYDTLSKYNLLKNHNLKLKQKEAFDQYEAPNGITGASRSHGKSEDYSYLEYYNLSSEYEYNTYLTREIIDSSCIAYADLKYAPVVVNPYTNNITKKFETPPVGSHFMHFLTSKNMLITYGFDGANRLYDIIGNSNKPIITFYKNKEDYIFLANDNYYKTNNHFDKIKFRYNDQIYDLQQFDLKYNRPDILLQRVGNKDSVLISSYHAAYLKRLKRMGFTEEMLKDDFHLPEIKIKNFESLPSITDSSDLNLNLDINDSKYKLDRINIFINDVPVYGTSGIDLRKENMQKINKKIKLSLSQGENKIQVSVLNQAGAESYKETVYITYKPNKSTKPDLYLITIGDSKYKDSRFDLTYASKDALDIANAFKSNYSYEKVILFTYTDEKVTRENILTLKEELKKAKRDDVVIITVAGHGVLDAKLDYYLATHDMDFSNPSEKGLAYEELESLLDGIAPLKKVLFLDACHSGEVDKEEVELLATNTTTNSKVKFRNAGAGIQKKNLGLKTTSELMGELFTDLRRGTGATVISSAGGAEYAMESDEWKNGLFTYCLLHGLKDKDADENKDGEIWLSELQTYLRKEVTELSNGAQQPTSRIENLSMDFRIW